MNCSHGIDHRFCAIHNGITRAIHQTPGKTPKSTTHDLKSKKQETIFLNGSPYVKCGHCGELMKKFDGDYSRLGSHDKFAKRDLERRIVVGKFIRLEEFDEEKQGFIIRWKLSLKSVSGCFKCWDMQQRHKLEEVEAARLGHRPERAVFFQL